MGSLYTLILTVCMIASPDGGRTPPTCKDVNVTVSLDQPVGEFYNHDTGQLTAPEVAPLDGGAERDRKNKGGFSPFLCQHIGMTEGVRYSREHPLWRPVRWSCPAPGSHHQEI